MAETTMRLDNRNFTNWRLSLLSSCVIAVIVMICGYAMAEEKPSTIAHDEWSKGFTLYGQGKYAQAILHFEASLTADRAYYRSWNGKGICLAFLGNTRDGIRYIEKALKLNRNYENGHFNMALALELSGRWRDAISSFDRALAIVPTNAWSHYGKACSYGMLGDATSAAICLKRAIALEPSCRIHAKTEKDLAMVRQHPKMVEVLKLPAKDGRSRGK